MRYYEYKGQTYAAILCRRKVTDLYTITLYYLGRYLWNNQTFNQFDSFSLLRNVTNIESLDHTISSYITFMKESERGAK